MTRQTDISKNYNWIVTVNYTLSPFPSIHGEKVQTQTAFMSHNQATNFRDGVIMLGGVESVSISSIKKQ